MCVCLAGIMLASLLCGCGAASLEETAPVEISPEETAVSAAEVLLAEEPASEPVEMPSEEPEEPSAEPVFAPSAEPAGEVSADMPAVEATPVPTAEPVEEDPVDTLSDTQRNSINMLNYLVVLTQEINESKNSCLYLEEAYSELINNTSPNAVDEWTLSHIEDMLQEIDDYRMIATKRERLQYIYEQNQAQALRNAVPNPLGLLSAVQSGNWLDMAASVVYMAVDSYSSYEGGMSDAEMEYLQDGWVLADEASAVLHNSRSKMFSYMVRMVQNNELPGELALSEEAVDKFVDWIGNSNHLQVIQFLEHSKSTYEAFGGYWLELAKNYYKNGDYDKCLDAVASYEELEIKLFRYDYDYADILPMAIIAAGEIMEEEDYISTAEIYAAAILDNANEEDWSLRYFAAQTYIDLCARTGDTGYLDAAYDIALNNVNNLLGDQKKLNTAYLGKLELEEAEKGADKEEKKEIKAYNDMLEAERKTELPPLCEPLLLNCDLLFALAEELELSEAERIRVDGILHENGEALFLSAPVDALYWLSKDVEQETAEIGFDGKEIVVPARYLTETATVTVTVTESGETTVFDDWQLSEVKRVDESDPDSFLAVYTGEGIKEHKFSAGSEIVIEIVPRTDCAAETLVGEYAAEIGKKLYVFDSLSFVRADA